MSANRVKKSVLHLCFSTGNLGGGEVRVYHQPEMQDSDRICSRAQEVD